MIHLNPRGGNVRDMIAVCNVVLKPKWICRKDIAVMLDVSYDQVRKNEKAWGLKPVSFARCVRYNRVLAEKALKSRGLLE